MLFDGFTGGPLTASGSVVTVQFVVFITVTLDDVIVYGVGVVSFKGFEAVEFVIFPPSRVDVVVMFSLDNVEFKRLLSVEYAPVVFNGDVLFNIVLVVLTFAAVTLVADTFTGRTEVVLSTVVIFCAETDVLSALTTGEMMFVPGSVLLITV